MVSLAAGPGADCGASLIGNRKLVPMTCAHCGVDSTFTLSELQYSTDTHGKLCLYLFDTLGYHTGAIVFHKDPANPNAQVSAVQARRLAERHQKLGLEVRACNASDVLVYHAKDGTVLYPANPEKFWETAGGEA